VKSPYLRVVSESLWRASHTLRTSSQTTIRDRPTNLMCCWHLHRGKRRELEYGTARLANSITGVLASVDVAIGLCTMWRALDRMRCPQGSNFKGPARLNIGLDGECYCSKCLPSRKRAKPDSTTGVRRIGPARSISLCLVISQ
jgi:hypothetical protein